jgi:hypothetical protein
MAYLAKASTTQRALQEEYHLTSKILNVPCYLLGHGLVLVYNRTNMPYINKEFCTRKGAS